MSPRHEFVEQQTGRFLWDRLVNVSGDRHECVEGLAGANLPWIVPHDHREPPTIEVPRWMSNVWDTV